MSRARRLAAVGLILCGLILGGAVGYAEFAPSNEPAPALSVASPAANSTHVVNATVAFNATLADRETGIERVTWDFNEDGFVDATGTNVTHRYATPGTYTAEVVATNATGETLSASVPVVVVESEAAVPEEDTGVDPPTSLLGALAAVALVVAGVYLWRVSSETE
ncbi:PKD domain-containing protein [Haloferax marisrubri]|uniref:PKD domain-containing protein n=1 Tax=Haloferax marisrubri TaxID=1544719 RepID=A0A2P4NNC9_9EURY|nr:PKD domain-containing protein [Haloferax marisrubri]POG54610.1 PKD domain-containing protein [Haloferax marisrubri]